MCLATKHCTSVGVVCRSILTSTTYSRGCKYGAVHWLIGTRIAALVCTNVPIGKGRQFQFENEALGLGLVLGLGLSLV